MRASLGQTIVIENVTGAGATIGVGRAAQAAPDGYTLSIGNWTSHVGAGAIYPVHYDVLKDLSRFAAHHRPDADRRARTTCRQRMRRS